MKKLLLLALVATATALFAGMDTAELRVVSAVAPQAVSAGSAVTNDVVVSSMKGIGEVLVTYSAAATNCEVTATLLATNRAAGGWYAVNSAAATGATVGGLRIPFAGEYLPNDLRVAIAAKTANATAAGAVILTYK